MNTDTIDHEPEPDILPTDALALRRPDTPVTLSELAARKGEAIEIIEARVQILETLRKAALRATSPEDWLLFKAPEEAGGQIVGYLQDSGCERVRDLSGIEIFNVGAMEKVATNDPKIFHYLISGDGRRKLTGQVIEQVEGGRSSTDDFCRDKTGADLELAVRKAARANLDGRIVRELAGLSNVPVDEITEAWAGTKKTIDRCRKGRGFGSRSERLGATAEGVPDVEPPVCPHCKTKASYRKGKNGRGDFWGCPNYTKHPEKKWTVDADAYLKEIKAKQPAATSTVSAAAAPNTNGDAKEPQQQPLTAGDVFGKNRQPGEDD